MTRLRNCHRLERNGEDMTTECNVVLGLSWNRKRTLKTDEIQIKSAV